MCADAEVPASHHSVQPSKQMGLGSPAPSSLLSLGPDLCALGRVCAFVMNGSQEQEAEGPFSPPSFILACPSQPITASLIP